jgi:hypothetical protein
VGKDLPFARSNKANSLSLSPYEGEKLIFSLLFKEGLKGEFYQLQIIKYGILKKWVAF